MSTPAPDAVRSFPAVIGERPQWLLLGSMPSVRSLALQQYYGHPRNRFWPLMQCLFDIDPGTGYAQRCLALSQQRIALWDVLASCERSGSLDSAIRRDSEQANAIVELLTEHASIRGIAFNGLAAEQCFKRHFRSQLGCLPQTRVRLPSTSPANAAWPLPRLLQSWRILATPPD